MNKPQIKVIGKNTSLFALSFPIFIELLLQMLVSNVDQFMLSRFSDNAVAAVGNVNQILNLVLIMFSVLNSATTIMVSQYLGAKQYDRTSEIYSVAVFFNLACGLLVGGGLVLFSRPLFAVMQVPAELVNDAVTYMNIVGSVIFLQALFSTLGVIFRCNGHMQYTMYVAVLLNITNIFGNSMFLYGWFGLPYMGVAGVAISSAVSRAIGVVVLMLLFRLKIDGHISLKYLKPFPWETLKRLLHIGLPAGGESLSYTLAQTVLLGFANTMGATTVSTRAYSMLIAWFAIVYSVSVSQGTQIIVGHLIGAGEEDSADKRVRKTLRPALLIALCVTILLYLFGGMLFSVFTKNPEIIALGRKIMLVEIILEIGRTTNLVIIRGLQASGDVRFPVFLGICSMWGVAVLVGYLLGLRAGLGLVGIWVGMACDECLRAVVVYIRWRMGVWRGRALVRHKPTENEGLIDETN